MRSCVIDPCGFGTERLYMRHGIDFALLTRPTEVSRRHDPLLIRMSASTPKRPFFTHIDFHLTGAKPGSMSMVKPFVDYRVPGLKRVMHAFVHQVADFLEGLVQDEPAAPTFKDALKTQYVCDAVLDSAKALTWQKVRR